MIRKRKREKEKERKRERERSRERERERIIGRGIASSADQTSPSANSDWISSFFVALPIELED